MLPPELLLKLRGVSREFEGAGSPLVVLRGVNLTVNAGDTLAIMGPSGCGKSTLLNIIGGLDRPNSGSVQFQGRDVHTLSEPELAEYRNRSIGFVFQLHHLLPQCTVLENVLVPSLVHPGGVAARARALELLDRVGLSERMDYRPGVLSGGERQRVAVARALINRPSLLLADEPTGSLSEEGSRSLMDLLMRLNRELGMALVVVTHAPTVANSMGRVYELARGELHAVPAEATP